MAAWNRPAKRGERFGERGRIEIGQRLHVLEQSVQFRFGGTGNGGGSRRVEQAVQGQNQLLGPARVQECRRGGLPEARLGAGECAQGGQAHGASPGRFAGATGDSVGRLERGRKIFRGGFGGDAAELRQG